MATELYQSPYFSDANLVSYYRLEANSNDSKGTNNMTDTASPTYGSGKFGNDISYNGTTQYSRVSSAFGMSYTSSRSISMWVKMNTDIGDGTTIWFGGLIFAANPGNYTGFLYARSGSTYTLVNNAGATITTGAFGTANYHHIVVTHNHGTNTSSIYFDGTKGTDGTTFTGDYSAQTTNLTTGANPLASVGNFVNAHIDDVSVFSDILTDAEVLEIYSREYPTGGFYYMSV